MLHVFTIQPLGDFFRSGTAARVTKNRPSTLTLKTRFQSSTFMGHEYAGTVAALGPGVNEFEIGERVAVEVHKGCDRCENCIKGWYTSCLNYGDLAKGHRAKGLTCDGGFAEYAVNHINTLYRLPDNLTFEQSCMSSKVFSAACSRAPSKAMAV